MSVFENVAFPLLLLDEPLSNLDAGLRDQMRGEVRSLQRRVKVNRIAPRTGVLRVSIPTHGPVAAPHHWPGVAPC